MSGDVCRFCEGPLPEQEGPGRPPIYCSPRCRYRAKDRRRADRRRAETQELIARVQAVWRSPITGPISDGPSGRRASSGGSSRGDQPSDQLEEFRARWRATRGEPEGPDSDS